MDDIPLDALIVLAEAGEMYHFIAYNDDEWVIVYEVVQPLVFVIDTITRL